MSRLSSQADMEYFPSHAPSTMALADRFNYNDMPETFRMIDPCAGEGDALRALAEGIRIEFQNRKGKRMLKKAIKTFGVELDMDRADAARKNLDRVVQTDYFNTIITDNVFNVMLLNPPYDYDPDYKRLEQRFLVKTTRLLGTGGIMIYMVPRYVLRVSAEFLARNFSGFHIWQDMENPDAQKFNQVMLMARRDNHPPDYDRMQKTIEDFADGRIEDIGTGDAYRIQPIEADVDRFSALRVDYGDVLEEVSRSGYETRKEWQDMHFPPTNDIVQPLMAPRTGHMGLIMAGGGVGGLGIPVIKEDENGNAEDAAIFRAAAKKVTQAVAENDSGTVQRISERMSSTAVTLDPRNWEFNEDVDLSAFVSKYSQELARYLSEVMPPKYTPEALRELLGHAPEYHKLLRKPMPGNGQRLAIEGTMFSLLMGERGTAVVGEMGTGKTFLSESAAYLAGYRRIGVLGPPTLVWKWEDEILKTIPGAKVFVVGKNPGGKKAKEPFYSLHKSPMKQLRWLERNYGHSNKDVPVFVVMAHSTAKLSYGRIPAVNWRWGHKAQQQYAEVSGELLETRWKPFTEQLEITVKDDETGELNRKVVERAVQRMCCPECGQPVLNPKGEYAEWDWLANRRRNCSNQITVGRTETRDEMGRPAYGTESRDCGNPLWQAHARNYVSNMPGTSPHGDETLKERTRRLAIYAESMDSEKAKLYGGRGSLSPDYEEDRWAAFRVDHQEIFRTKQYPPRRYDLAEYYKRYMPDFLDLLIADEFHQCAPRHVA